MLQKEKADVNEENKLQMIAGTRRGQSAKKKA